MKRWITKNWNIIFPVLFILFCVCGHYFTSKRNTDIAEHGVWTIYEIDYVSFAPRGGKQAKAYYRFGGIEYKDGTGVDYQDREGDRFFMALMPDKPTKVTYTGDRVPSWFTLDAPPEGWPTKPTEAELREMMMQDSLKWGLR